MAAWAVGQTDRFGASVAMSVVSNYVSFHLTSEVWWYDHAILEGEWHDPASQYMDRSPVTHAHKGSTPTLILQGAIDRCTPVSQADELFTAIAETGTEVELVVYPREGHVPLERGARPRCDPANAGVVRPPPVASQVRSVGGGAFLQGPAVAVGVAEEHP